MLLNAAKTNDAASNPFELTRLLTELLHSGGSLLLLIFVITALFNIFGSAFMWLSEASGVLHVELNFGTFGA